MMRQSAAPSLRSIAYVVVAPILLGSVTVSSLVFIPSSSPATTTSIFLSSSPTAPLRRATATTPSIEHPKRLWNQRRLSNHGWAAVGIGTRAVGRNYFSTTTRTTTTALVVRDQFPMAATTVAAPAAADFDIDSSASEWRRVAGFQHQEVHEAMEIARIQRQARAVTHKPVPTGGGGGGGNIQLKKQLVTSIFSTPAVAHRRRNRSEPQLSIDEPTNLLVVPAAVQASTTRAHEERTTDAHTIPLESEHVALPSSNTNPSFHQPPDASVVPASTPSDTAKPAIPAPPENAPTTSTIVAADDNANAVGSKNVVAAVEAPATVTATADEASGAPTLGAATEEEGPVRVASISLSNRPRSASTAPATKTPLSDRVRRLRSQPKSAMVESILQARYAAISDVGLRAYQILCDLEMVVPTPNRHDDPNYDSSRDDDEPAPENNY